MAHFLASQDQTFEKERFKQENHCKLNYVYLCIPQILSLVFFCF